MSRRAIVTVPKEVKRGQVLEVRTLAQHPMESGFRRTQLGEAVPRDIIRTFACSYNGAEVFRMELHPAIAANPFIAFSVLATESGTLECRWSGDNGYAVSETARITVV